MSKDNKQCAHCRVPQPADNFHRNARSSDGLDGRCKDCKRIYSAGWRRDNPTYFSDWRSKNSEHLSAYEKVRAARRNTQEHHARIAANRAIARGDLQREPCLFCGDEPSEAHHHDYELPLVVTWLCSHHHRHVHATEERLNRAYKS